MHLLLMLHSHSDFAQVTHLLTRGLPYDTWCANAKEARSNPARQPRRVLGACQEFSYFLKRGWLCRSFSLGDCCLDVALKDTRLRSFQPNTSRHGGMEQMNILYL